MKTIISFVVLVSFCLYSSTEAQISISTLGSPYTQDFNTLAVTGTSSTVPAGWFFIETGTSPNTTYAASHGGSSTGNTYSFGALDSTDRALGGLQSGSVIPTFGAQFVNNTGRTIRSLDISYTGEQWRLGGIGRGSDRIDFQYSLDAASLLTGTWIDVDVLDFASPNTTTIGVRLDGNLSENRTALNNFIEGVNIPNGSTFWIRWTDFNVTNSDDGLAVDDFSLTASAPTAAAVSVSGSVRTAKGLPVRNASVTIFGGDLSGPVTVATGSFGVYSFNGLRAGQTYFVTVSAGRYTFQEPVRTVIPMDNVDDLDFVAN